MHNRVTGYSFLAELDGCRADQISDRGGPAAPGPAVLEPLPSKQIVLGVLDLGDPAGRDAGGGRDRIRAALEHVPPERLLVAPDCGMKYLPRAVARGKLRAMVEGADARTRGELWRLRAVTARLRVEDACTDAARCRRRGSAARS